MKSLIRSFLFFIHKSYINKNFILVKSAACLMKLQVPV